MSARQFRKSSTRRLALKRLGLTALGAMAATSLAAPALRAEEDDTFSQNEIVEAVANFFGVTSEAAAEVVEKIFADLGRPNAYIKGDEFSGAIGVGLRYGEGTMVRKGYRNKKVYWQGPSIGFDLGANASKCFTLVYAIRRQEEIFQRFPGVEGSYYFIAGIGVNYQRSGRISLAPMRTGVGLRAGVNVGYLHYTPEQEWFPL